MNSEKIKLLLTSLYSHTPLAPQCPKHRQCIPFRERSYNLYLQLHQISQYHLPRYVYFHGMIFKHRRFVCVGEGFVDEYMADGCFPHGPVTDYNHLQLLLGHGSAGLYWAVSSAWQCHTSAINTNNYQMTSILYQSRQIQTCSKSVYCLCNLHLPTLYMLRCSTDGCNCNTDSRSNKVTISTFKVVIQIFLL